MEAGREHEASALRRLPQRLMVNLVTQPTQPTLLAGPPAAPSAQVPDQPGTLHTPLDMSNMSKLDLVTAADTLLCEAAAKSGTTPAFEQSRLLQRINNIEKIIKVMRRSMAQGAPSCPVPPPPAAAADARQDKGSPPLVAGSALDLMAAAAVAAQLRFEAGSQGGITGQGQSQGLVPLQQQHVGLMPPQLKFMGAGMPPQYQQQHQHLSLMSPQLGLMGAGMPPQYQQQHQHLSLMSPQPGLMGTGMYQHQQGMGVQQRQLMMVAPQPGAQYMYVIQAISL